MDDEKKDCPDCEPKEVPAEDVKEEGNPA